MVRASIVQNLQAQLKSKENDIESLRDNLDKSDGKSTTVSPVSLKYYAGVSFYFKNGVVANVSEAGTNI